MKFVRRTVLGVLVVAVVAYCGVLGWFYVNQRAIQYDTSGRLFALSETALDEAELVGIPTADGTALAAWYQRPAAGKPAILYFRGNSQSFSREHVRYAAFVADGYGFLAFDYRGFPGSPGEVTQEHVLADALAAYDWLAEKGDPIVLWGRSLGSGPATYVASVRDADALLLETPFLSAAAVASERYPYLLIGPLMHDQYPVSGWIAGVTEPVFVAHGTADRTIGVRHGTELHRLAPHPAGLWIVEGADHGDLWDRGIWDQAKVFFAEAEASRAVPAI